MEEKRRGGGRRRRGEGECDTGHIPETVLQGGTITSHMVESPYFATVDVWLAHLLYSFPALELHSP